jgi:histidyl-tRNA synthetase
MELSTKPLSGMRQLYPADMRVESFIVEKIRSVAALYGFEEYDAPTLEPVELFLAKSGSELVLEQSYCFPDRGGRQLVLRPELTPSLARMIAASPELRLPVRWTSFPLCFRYERPQRGRVREFRQFNCDILGVDGIAADVEILLVLDRIVRSFGPPKGSWAIRMSSRTLASEFLEALGVDGGVHPAAFAVIDRKAKLPPEEWTAWAAEKLGGDFDAVRRFAACEGLGDPLLEQKLRGRQSLLDMRSLVETLGNAGVESISFDPCIVRGLDYYTGTVFELMDTGGENRRAVCGGGRYDNLVGLFGGKPMTGIGFGLGILTLKLFLETYGVLPADILSSRPPDVFVAVFSSSERDAAFAVSESMRTAGLAVEMDIEGRSMGRQFSMAARLGARFVAVIGPDEVASGTVTLKDMERGAQQTLPTASAVSSIVTETSG